MELSTGEKILNGETTTPPNGVIHYKKKKIRRQKEADYKVNR